MSRFFLSYSVAEKSREHDGRADDEQAGPDHHHDLTGDAFLPRVHLDVDLQAGIDGDDGGNGVEQVEDIQQVLYFGYNAIDNQLNTKV